MSICEKIQKLPTKQTLHIYKIWIKKDDTIVRRPMAGNYNRFYHQAAKK